MGKWNTGLGSPIRGVPSFYAVSFSSSGTFLKCNLIWKLYLLISSLQLAKEELFSTDLSDESVVTYHSQLQNESYMAFLNMLLLDLSNPEKVTATILVLGAEDDRIFSSNEVIAMVDTYNAKVHIFPNMAHDMMLETGWKEVTEYIHQ